VKKLMFDNKRLPYIFFNGEAVAVGNFPTYEEFATLIKLHLKGSENSGKVNEN
jgi:hypothetical protein